MNQQAQRGGFLTTFLMIVFCLFAAVVGMKVFPAYLEYFAVKRTLQSMASNGETNGSSSDIRGAFGRRAAVNDIKSVTADQLEIDKSADGAVVTANWPVTVPLFGNMKLVIDFSASSK